MENTKFCINCGEKIDSRAEICPHCGVRIKRSWEKNSGIAAILSFFVPGLGQIYNGEIGKGLILIASIFISMILMIILVGFLMYLVIWVYSIYDAYNTAERINATV